jgi:molybdopterin-containing oxidoreductase family iron-sulfur binding subunit
VRRFNFLEYTGNTDPLFTLLYNPDVTVRSRGVMEKCTFCVQRINAARIQASIRAGHDGQPLHIPDGEIVTACQAACPSQAINFGDLKDPQSDVHRLARQPHGFGVLAELGTRPRVTYLAKVFNTAEEASA